MYKIIEKLWLTAGAAHLGIVVVEDDITHERKAYIGLVPGHDEVQDAGFLVDWGAPFPEGMIIRLAATVGLELKKKRGKKNK